MSYILDALKKAERERGISKVPTLTTIHELRNVRRHQVWIIVGGIALSVALLAWFSLPSLKTVTQPQAPTQVDVESDDGEALPQNSPGEPSVPAIAQISVPEAHEAKPDTPAVSVPSPKTSLPADQAVTRKSAEVKHGKSISEETAVVAQEDGQSSSPVEDYATEEDTNADEPPVNAPPLDQNRVETKPASLREAAARMTLNIHVYSGVKDERLVFINGKKYLEGDYVDGQYLLEEITPEGVVLSHEGDKTILRPGRK